ncbi:HAMP domain-containing sensor histidine kinase [Mechercharimyces sp. CAU 1602]|uniref:sensor histidine kinase n=1 Tax=Mechercharimyces sp. CAU 1602 TaxID=2973933 RepID=UPI0021625B65|nr:HAMP domain-containing sensor histidine kinase [Mechercharimyces sp. CAU 1602]MCS1352074.1 HAMP domain-containing histidine kinase [Mechercharimyces sp. CAU 1602]
MKSSRKKHIKRTPLLRHWTHRYVFILLVSMVIIIAVSTYWMRENGREKQLEILQLNVEILAEDMERNYVAEDGIQVWEGMVQRILAVAKRGGPPALHQKKQDSVDMYGKREEVGQAGEPVLIQVVDDNGTLIFPTPKAIKRNKVTTGNIEANFVTEPTTYKFTYNNESWYMISQPISYEEKVVANIHLAVSEKNLLQEESAPPILPWLLVIAGISVVGWFVVYLLSRKLTHPIREVALAATQIRRGNYDITLPQDAKEEEIYQLTSSFAEMANRLQRLESLRTELLAGVTHELKTPITSISGLLQAVDEKVVTGAERDEFVQLSLQETRRLRRMVEDLLDFNTYATGSFQVKREVVDVNQLLQQVVQKWQVSKGESGIEVSCNLPPTPLYAVVDPARTQQILLNLINNSRAALSDQGKIGLQAYRGNHDAIMIEVSDTGSGIPVEEQSMIFERFFRGANKKERVRGLGLGLPISKMLATEQRGDLTLKESSSEGTTFLLTVEAARKPDK